MPKKLSQKHTQERAQEVLAGVSELLKRELALGNLPKSGKFVLRWKVDGGRTFEVVFCDKPEGW